MAEGTSTKSYDGIDKAALFELLKKKKNWKNIAFSQGLFTLTEMAKTT